MHSFLPSPGTMCYYIWARYGVEMCRARPRMPPARRSPPTECETARKRLTSRISVHKGKCPPPGPRCPARAPRSAAICLTSTHTKAVGIAPTRLERAHGSGILRARCAPPKRTRSPTVHCGLRGNTSRQLARGHPAPRSATGGLHRQPLHRQPHETISSPTSSKTSFPRLAASPSASPVRPTTSPPVSTSAPTSPSSTPFTPSYMAWVTSSV